MHQIKYFMTSNLVFLTYHLVPLLPVAPVMSQINSLTNQIAKFPILAIHL